MTAYASPAGTPGKSNSSLGLSSEEAAPLSVADARANAKSLVFQQGRNPVWSTPVAKLSGLGIGFQLYFTLLDRLFYLFLLLSILALPSLIINYSGSRIPAVDVDPFLLSLFSLGNQGSQCGPDGSPTSPVTGTCDPCADTSKMCVLGASIDASTASYIVTGAQTIAFLGLVYFSHSLLARDIAGFQQERDQTAPSAARYSVLVRGLPPDVLEEDVAALFSDHYALSKTQPHFPILGMSKSGVRRTVFWSGFYLSLTVGLANYFVYTGDSSQMDDFLNAIGFGYSSAGVSLLLNLLSILLLSALVGYLFVLYTRVRRIGASVDRPAPQETYEKRVQARRAFEKERNRRKSAAGSSKADKAKVYVAPDESGGVGGRAGPRYAVTDDVEAAPQAAAGVEKCDWEEYYDETHAAYYYYNATTGESAWEKPENFWHNTPPEAGGGEGAESAESKFQPLGVSKPVMYRRNHTIGSVDYATRYVGMWVTE
ncbi:hypothetical protein TeGR_g5621, partial [Tetraparma gracilis]